MGRGRRAATWTLLFLMSLVTVTGCGGCRQETPEERAAREAKEKKEAEERKKPDFEVSAPRLQPTDASTAICYAKPGHWTSATQRMKANFDDFVGEKLTVVVSNKSPVPVKHTPFWIRAARPVVLAKARPKNVASLFYVPQNDEAMEIESALRYRNSGRYIAVQQTPLARMPPYQYHFVILAREPTRYTYLQSIDSVLVPFDGETDQDDTEDVLHYRLRQPRVSKTIPLPDNPLAWTSIAYILWDEVDAELFTVEQERALLDWLHWGGQLIISGPDSLGTLETSFLSDYLPATSDGARTFTAADLRKFSRGWRLASQSDLEPTVPWSGIRLQLRPAANWLPSSTGLLAERDVGRGRIVVSAMQLAERDLINWRSGFQSWFNACVLRRPPRQYARGYFGDVTLHWAGSENRRHRLDAKLTSNLRYFSRDVGIDTNYHRVSMGSDDPDAYGQVDRSYEWKAPESIGGIGAWNDFSGVAEAARQVLKEAAGITIPGAGFVVFWLAAYLLVLVPFNWFFFRALDRVEWAWVAAPLIAILGTIIVINRAQLDIGLVRSQTEIGVIELQPDYRRAHLTRYTALYTSLSTTYGLTFDELTTLASPFPRDKEGSLLSGQSRSEVVYEKYDQVRLRGLQVSSNSTDMVHSEQMLPLDGVIQLDWSSRGSQRVVNLTQFDLQSVGVVQRPTIEEADKGRTGLQGIWIGKLGSRESALVSFPSLNLGEGQAAFAEERRAEARHLGGAELDFEPLFRMAYGVEHFEPGEKRLVALVDGVLPGQQISPKASQVHGAALLVAHLGYEPRPEALPDRNTRATVMAE